jgi:NADH:ubiquinone oxidoreductase subunit E
MKKILVCTNYRANPNNPSCAARRSKELLASLKQEFALQKVLIEVESSPCMGFCEIGPNARLVPNGSFIHKITAKKLQPIIVESKKFLQE